MIIYSVVSKPGNHLGHINYTSRIWVCILKAIVYVYWYLLEYYFKSFMSHGKIKWQGIMKYIYSGL